MKKGWGYLPGILCLLYYIVVCLITARMGGAQLAWLALAVFLLSYAYLWKTIKATGRKEVLRRKFLALRFCTALLILGLSCGVMAEGMILTSMMKEPEPESEYIIVLGAKVNGTTPSWSLRYRIDSAAEYLKENPECVAIASGGQGADEGISEALAIKNFLVEKGIEEDRVLLEDRSTSTEENLIFSGAIIESCGGSMASEVVIVTSDFHMFRALRLAENIGYDRVQGKTAKTLWTLVPQNHMREILAIGYYFVTGAI